MRTMLGALAALDGRRAAYVGQYQLELRLGNAAAERIGYGVALAVVLGTHRSHGSGGTG